MPAPVRSVRLARPGIVGFLSVDTRSEAGGWAVIEGAATLPGLPVRRLRLRADADRLYLYGPDVDTLARYVADELRADVREELPRN